LAQLVHFWVRVGSGMRITPKGPGKPFADGGRLTGRPVIFLIFVVVV